MQNKTDTARTRCAKLLAMIII